MECGRFVPIPPDALAIRILTLEPGNQDDQIYCSLNIAHFFSPNLSGMPSYEALSYVWGEQRITELIECSGKQTSVTTSLASALRVLRHSSEPRRLWVDQLCIDQTNVDERNHQVRIMSLIYRVASRVLVWLGPDIRNEAEVAFNLLEQLARQNDGYPNLLTTDNFPGDDILMQAGLPTRESPQWNALRTLFSLPYFERTWVVQELLLSQDATFFWGSCQIRWGDTFAKAILWAAGNKFGFPSLDGQFQGIPEMGEAELFIFGRRQSLLGLLDATRRRKATDPRDKIFALLGITEKISGKADGKERIPFYKETLIQPDYRLSLCEVYVSVTLAILAKAEDLEVLSLVDHGIVSSAWDHLGPLPNWVPRWQPALAWPIDLSSHKASGSTKAKMHATLREGELALEGIIVDKISNNGLLLSNGHELQSPAMPDWQLGLLEENCFVDESISEVQGASLLYLFQKHSGGDEVPISQRSRESMESLHNVLEETSNCGLRLIAEGEDWKDPITECWKLAGNTVSTDTFILFAKSRFSSLTSALKRNEEPSDVGELAKDFTGGYLDSAIEAARHWDNTAGYLEKLEVPVLVNLMSGMISLFHS
jgi:hypothetical protein